MLQTHAFDGWVSPSAKAGLGYAFSRALANIPAPLFLLLAGVGLSLGRRLPQRAARAMRRFVGSSCGAGCHCSAGAIW